jgi:hypothetical protein
MYEALGPDPGDPAPARAAPRPTGAAVASEAGGPGATEGAKRIGPGPGGGAKGGGRDGKGAAPPPPPGLALVGPSRWWLQVRAGPEGPAFVRNIMRQLLLALAAAHAANVTHRDVKPENLLVTFDRPPGAAFDRGGGGGGGGGKGSSSDKAGSANGGGAGGASIEGLHVRLIDWGSAADEFSAAELYGRGGPGLGDLTLEYAPPEVYFAGR